MNCAPKDNPFRTSKLDSIDYQLSDRSWDDVFQDFRQIPQCSVVGQKGTGKTCFLLSFAEYIGPDACYIRLSNDGLLKSLSVIAKNRRRVLLLDGVEGFLPFQRLAVLFFLKHFVPSFLIALHNITEMPVLFQTEVTSSMAKRLVANNFELSKQDEQKFSERASVLISEMRGNMRNVLLKLYDEFGTKI